MATNAQHETIEHGFLKLRGRTLFHCSFIPKQPVRAYLYFLHGYGDHSCRYLHFFRWLSDRGIACHAFDFRGHGRSSGRRGYVSHWHDYVDDLTNFLEAKPATLPNFFLGHSHGGLVLAQALLDGILPSSSGCLFSSPYFRPAITVPVPMRIVAQVLNVIWPSIRLGSGIDPSWLSSDPEMIEDTMHDSRFLRKATPRWFFSSLRQQREVLQRAAEIMVPLMVFSGDDDRLADVEAMQEFYEKSGSTDKQYLISAGKRHELLRETDHEQVFEDVHSWIIQHLESERLGKTEAVGTASIA